MAKKQTKKVAKKTTTKKETENLPALQEAGLDSAALAAHANYDLAEFAGVGLDVDDNSEMFKNDILIPKIWLVQAMSEMRKQKKADEGEFVDSQTAEILAAEGEELNFVVLKTFKRIQTFKIVGEKKEFVSSSIMHMVDSGKKDKHDMPIFNVVFNENMNGEMVQRINKHDEYEFTEEGNKYRRRQVISAYVLIERDAVRGMNKPYIVDFAASSKYAGRKMISDIKTLNNNGLPSFVAFFKMTAHEENFEDGSAFVKDVQFGGYLPKASMPFLVDCRKGLDAIENQIEIDDSDVIDAAKTTTKKADTNVNGAAATTDAGI